MLGFYIFLSIAIGAVAGTAVYFILRAAVRGRMAASLGTALFLVKIPRPSAGAGAGGEGSAGSGEHGTSRRNLRILNSSWEAWRR